MQSGPYVTYSGMLSKIYLLRYVCEGGHKARQDCRPPLGGQNVAGSMAQAPSQAIKHCGRASSPTHSPHPAQSAVPSRSKPHRCFRLARVPPKGQAEAHKPRYPLKGPQRPHRVRTNPTSWSTRARAIVMAKSPQSGKSTSRRPGQSPTCLSNPCGSPERKR